MVQEWLREATPRPRSGAAAESARLQQPRSSQKELPQVRGQEQWPRGAIPCLRPGVASRRSYPTPEVRDGGREEQPQAQERWLCGCRRAKRSYSSFKVRRGGCEEIPLIQGKEQWLHFAGAAVKRYPTSKVRETQVRW